MIIGIVGCGGIARAHVNALCLNPLVTGLALYDVSPDNVRQLSEISSLPVTNCQDLEQLAGVSQGFIICTPNHLHVSVAEEVLRYKYRRYLRCYVYHVPDRCNLMDSVWHYAI